MTGARLSARFLLVAAAAACLAGAVALSSFWGRGGRRDAAASLGGLRVLWADALFLRAEGLRKEGRVEDLPALYRQILDLDPGNEDAIDFLATTQARDLRVLATTPEGRVRWWRAGRDLVAEGLRASPRSARLHWRMADLLVSVGDADPAVAAAIAAEGPDRLLTGLRHLRESIRLVGSLPRLGFAHLDAMTLLAPRLAAERLAAGGADADVEEAIAAGGEALELRAEELASFLAGRDATRTAAERLEAGLLLVSTVRECLRASPPQTEAAREAVGAYEGVLGEADAASRALRNRLR